MRTFKEVLRLKFDHQLTNRKIAKSCAISHVTVGKYLEMARQAGIPWPLPDGLDDAHDASAADGEDEADERESGQRALLNLGHTFGHAIETGMGYGEWLHGEAVGAGMCMAARMSRLLGWLDEHDVQRTVALCDRAKLPVMAPGTMNSQRFLELMAVDKKVMDGQLRLVLLKDIGQAIVTADFDPDTLKQTLHAA